MRNLIKVLGAATIMGASLLTTVAHADVSTMTCSQFAALPTEADEMKAASDLLAWINDAANVTAAGSLVAKYASNATGEENKWPPNRMEIEIEGHCWNAPADVTIVKRLQEHS